MLAATMAMRRLLRTTRQVAIATLAGLILLAGLNTSQAGNWWDQNFETNPVSFSEDDGTKSWGVFKSHGNNPHNRYHVGVVTSGHPVRFGAQSIRFQVAPGQCGGGDCSWGSERSELLVGTFDRPGNDVWYSWSVYHQNYKFLNGGVSPIHGQFKTMNTGHQYAFFMVEPRGMVISMDEFEKVRPEVLIPANQLSNQWHDIRLHAKWSTGVDGIFQIWVDGKLRVDRRGANAVNNDVIAFRFGLYRPQVYRASNNHSQVVYYDELMRGGTCQSVSQFMACGGNTDGASSNVFQTTDLNNYVNKYGDLLTAYSAVGRGISKASWGKQHYCNYGYAEGRTSHGLTASVCTTTLNTTSPTIKVSVNDILEQGNRFSTEITHDVREFSKTAVFNGDMFSFKDYETFTAVTVRENQGLMLGISKHRDKYGVLDDPVGIGWLFDDIALMVAQDDSMFGYMAEGVFDFRNPTTTYVDAGFRKKLAGNAILYADLMYAFGRSQPGELTTLSHLHALGVETRLDVETGLRHRFQFRFDLPLRIEHGFSRFYVEQGARAHPLMIDLEPAARQSSLSLSHNYRLSTKSQLTSGITYTRNKDHQRGRNRYGAMMSYRVAF